MKTTEQDKGKKGILCLGIIFLMVISCYAEKTELSNREFQLTDKIAKDWDKNWRPYFSLPIVDVGNKSLVITYQLALKASTNFDWLAQSGYNYLKHLRKVIDFTKFNSISVWFETGRTVPWAKVQWISPNTNPYGKNVIFKAFKNEISYLGTFKTLFEKNIGFLEAKSK